MAEQQKLNEFDNPSQEAWRKLVDRDLAGAPFEKKLVKKVAGVEVRPLYVKADAVGGTGLPGFAPFTRGDWALGGAEMGWDVRAEIVHSEPELAAKSILEQLNGEASSLFVVFDRAARAGSNEHGSEGAAIENLAELETVFAQVFIDKIGIAFDAGATALPIAAGLIALANKRRVNLTALGGSLGIDPLGTLAKYGSLPNGLEAALADAAEVARFASEHAPRLRAVVVDTTAYNEAGADAAVEVALALATGVEYLRALTKAGLTIDQAAKQISFRLSVGRDFFIEIAKLRAARRTWARVVAASGGSAEAQAFVVHARTARRTKTQRDPWVNLLRGTAETFAAAVGGADAITTSSFDAELGEPDELALRMARNTQHLLRHESNVHRVVDPAGGSWYVEQTTEQLAQRGWQRFQALERQGGVARALFEGGVQQELKAQLDAERSQVEQRKLAITGVNEFPFAGEAPVARSRGDVAKATARAKAAADRSSFALTGLDTRPGARFQSAIQAIERGAAFSAVRAALSGGDPARVTPLLRERLSQPFETLRDRAERGVRPKAFLANLGPIPEHKARAGYAHNFMEAGGFQVLSNDGFASADQALAAFQASGAEVAVLCSSDEVYASLAEPAAQALRGVARAVVYAGAPGEREAALKAAGVTDFIFTGINAVEVLRSLLERAGAQ
ncbi:MAG TPA: methylmalonyl-CoA mutase family protein [Polyangiales bacterium]|nr:methylmalonyl-CoA mutase family protein [Polyangiales bacterium]